MTDQARQPKGIPVGGRYAATVHAEPGLTLGAAPAADLLVDADGTEWDWRDREDGILESAYLNGVGIRLGLEREDGRIGYDVVDQFAWKVVESGEAETVEEAKAAAKARRERLAGYREGGLPLRTGARTPWGRADWVTHLAPGIDVVSTPGHGGIKLSRNRNKEVDPAWRGASGWYEEDCDWAIAAITHPDGFTEDQVGEAHASARRWHPEEYMQVVGSDPAKYGVADYRPIQPGESVIWDEKVFFAENWREVERVQSAVSTDDGMVKVSLATVDAAGKTTDDSQRRTVVMLPAEYDEIRTGDHMTVTKGAYYEPF